MTDSASSILLLRLQSTGSNTNLWGGYLNTAMQTIEQASKGYEALAVTGDATISWTQYATGNTGQVATLKLTGSLTSTATLTFPAYKNFLLVWNAAGQTVTVKCSGGTGVAIPNGRKTFIFCDGTDYYSAAPSWNTDSITLTNAGDYVNKTILEAAIAAASGLTAPFVLVTAADTTAGYLGAKTTSYVSGLTTTQLTGLITAQATTLNSGANEKRAVVIGNGYVNGFLDGGPQSATFTPVVGYAYDVDCSSAGVTVNLSGMTTPQLGQMIYLNKFGNNTMLLSGTVNGSTNLTISDSDKYPLRYSGSSWGWN